MSQMISIQLSNYEKKIYYNKGVFVFLIYKKINKKKLIIKFEPNPLWISNIYFYQLNKKIFKFFWIISLYILIISIIFLHDT